MQILLVNGGEVSSGERSIEDIEVSLERMRSHQSWKSSLQKELGEDYEVLFSPMPNPSSAKYSEWKIIFDKVSTLIDDDIVLIGHSLGGIFLAKYLTENVFPKKIKAIVLIAAPYNDETLETLGDFKLERSVSSLQDLTDKIYIFHSLDDPIVNYAEYQKYQNDLPKSIKMLYNDKQHFNLEEFPELVKLIKKL